MWVLEIKLGFLALALEEQSVLTAEPALQPEHRRFDLSICIYKFGASLTLIKGKNGLNLAFNLKHLLEKKIAKHI